MGYLIFFVVAFILILLVYKLFVIRKENALNKMKKSKDVQLNCRDDKATPIYTSGSWDDITNHNLPIKAK